LGMDGEKIHTLRNGIDGVRFHMKDRVTSRAALGVPDSARRVLACVGNIVAEKGTDRVLEAVVADPALYAVFAGDGGMRASLEARVREARCQARVKFLGSVPQTTLVDVYNVADVAVLASQREGWPNVVLEAMACGCPVVASDVGAVREMITNDTVGKIVSATSQIELNEGIASVLVQCVDRSAIRAHALTFDWASVTREQAALYANVARARR
jgi:teichuronic acid biosynthesis glycosyltransferase TuaC